MQALMHQMIERLWRGPRHEVRWTAWHFVGAALLTAAGVWITRDAWGSMLHIAITDEEATHCMLVAVAVPWLVWARRWDLRRLRPVGTWVGPVIVAIGAASFLYGFDIQDNEFWFFGAILIACGGLLSFLGIQVLVKLLPAFIVLGFLIPVPGLIRIKVAMPLQTVMAHAAEQMAQIIGITMSRSGNVLIAGGQRIEVAEACNGMRMVFGLFLVAYTFAFAMPLRGYVRLLILVAAPALALLCNTLRILPTVAMYGYGPEGVASVFHEVAGWLMIPLAFGLLMGSVRLLEWLELPVTRPAADGGGEPRAADRVPRGVTA